MSMTTVVAIEPAWNHLGRPPDPAALAAPLPPALAETIATDGRAARHANLAARYRSKRAALISVGREVEQARAADDAELASALETGRKPKAPKAPAFEETQQQLRHEVDLLAGRLVEAAGPLLAAALPVAAQVEQELDEKVTMLLAEAAEHLAAAAAAITKANQAAGESSWIAEFVARGSATPWRDARGRVVPQAEQAVVVALRRIVEEPVEARERLESMRRDIVAVNVAGNRLLPDPAPTA
jgi:hypothetical protein